MPNIAAVLKDEIRRLAKKEVKAEIGTTKNAVVQYRKDIAKLKRLVQAQQREIAFLKAQEGKRLGQRPTVEKPSDNVRFSARSVKAQRKRLKLSAEDYGKLVGVSTMTIYSWEQGKSRPRNAQLARLVAVRGIGKREALAKLEVLNGKEKA
jgi:DNA-binding transcriptional regulator YiaG